MNRLHHWICRSGYWKRTLASELLPWALDGIDLGEEVLEIGPGYGAATDILRGGVDRMTCVELDGQLARALALRMAGTNVRVVHGDAVRLPFRDGRFSAAVCFTVLHHVAAKARQDLLIAEAARVLRRGGILIATDTYRGSLFRMVHAGDAFAPIDPESLLHRLRSAGFAEAAVDVRGATFRFRARRG